MGDSDDNRRNLTSQKIELNEWTDITTFIRELWLWTAVVVRSAVTGPDSNRGLSASTPKYHAADKHDTPPSHFKLTLAPP